MLSLSDTQKALAYSANPKQVTLVRIETYTNYDAETVDETLYYATVPLRYRWDGSNVVSFRGFLESVAPLKRGFEHVPNGFRLSTRDGLTVRFETGEWADLNVWDLVRSANLIGAKIEVATLLIDAGDETAPEWIDQSTLAKDHIVRFRGEITQVPEYRADSTTFDLVADSIEPVLDLPQALDASEVSQKDLGTIYPVPVGEVKRIPLVQRTVGWVTTLGSDISEAFTGNVTVTDATGFPDSGSFAFWIGAERLLATYIGTQTINITTRAVTIGAVASIAVTHNAGAVMIEEIETANFVYSGVESLGLDALYCRSPQSGELVFIPPGLYGAVQADDSIDAGQPLGIVSFTQELMGLVIQLLNNAAAITVQPVVTIAGVDMIQVPLSNHALEANYGPDSKDCANYIFGSDGAGFTKSTGQDDAIVLWNTSADVPSQSRTVSRFRIVFPIRIQGDGTNLTKLHYTLVGSPLNTNNSKELLRQTSAVGEIWDSVSTEWFSPGSTTLADLVNSETTPSTNGPRVYLYLDQSGGGGFGTSQFSWLPGSYYEVELVPLVPSVTNTETTGAQEIGFNLDLFADVRGAVTIDSETSINIMDDKTNWLAENVVITNVGGLGDGFTAEEDGTSTFHQAAITGQPAMDFSSHRFRFDYNMQEAVWAGWNLGGGTFRIFLLSSNGNDKTWKFPKSCLHHTGWREFTFDPFGSASQLSASTGSLDLSAVVQINLQWDTTAPGATGAISFRDLRAEGRTYHTHPLDVAEWLIEENAGLTNGVDAGSFSTAKTNLPGVVIAGDLRNAGPTFAEVLGRIGYECRTNFIATEGASASAYKALNALATYAFTAVAKTIDEYADLIVISRQLDDQPTEFMAVYDFRNDLDSLDLTGYRALLRADATQNDISADVPTSDLTDAQALRGIRPTEPMPFYLLPDSASAIEVWAYYVAEALRATSLRFRMQVGFRYSYDLEPGDIVDFVPPWQVGAIKCRVTSITRPYDEPAATLELVEVE